MRLSELILKDAMDLSLPTSEKNQTLYHLANRFAKTGLLNDFDSYVEKLKAREEEFTTGVGDEIAIPHAQEASIQKAAIIMGRSQNGIDWESFDGQPAKLIFMIAAPEGGGEHLKALASL